MSAQTPLLGGASSANPGPTQQPLAQTAPQATPATTTQQTTTQQPTTAPTNATTTAQASTPPATTTTPMTSQAPAPAANDEIAKAIALLTAMAARPRPEADLAAHLREAAAEKDEPWRKRRAAIKRRTAGWDDEFQSDPAGAWESLRQHFGKAGRNALLDEDRAQELATILCASPLQMYRRARALLQLPPGDRMALHNFTVADAMGEGFVETWGPVLESLPVPLFPARPEHEDTNQKMLAQMAGYTSVSGGGPSRHPRLTVFARPLPIASGAGYKAPVEDGAVDLGIVENEFDNVGARLRAVTARLEALEAGASRGRGRGGRGRGNGAHHDHNNYNGNGQPQQYSHQPQQQYNNQPHYNNNPQQQQYGHNGGQYNGNGRGRGRGGQGGSYVRGRGEDPQQGNAVGEEAL